MAEYELTLHHPITDEEWDVLTDVDLDHTSEITFHTKHGKEVRFYKRVGDEKEYVERETAKAALRQALIGTRPSGDKVEKMIDEMLPAAGARKNDREGLKPIIHGSFYFCPACKYACTATQNYCGKCGQKFDRSDQNNKQEKDR